MRLQMDRSSVSIAIGEPIGGGMFVSNVVLAAVVWFSPQRQVEVVQSAFLRDSSFYAGGVLLLALVVFDAKVRVPLVPVLLHLPEVQVSGRLTRCLMPLPLSSNGF